MFQFPAYDEINNRSGFTTLTLSEALQEARKHWDSSSYGWGVYLNGLPWWLSQVQKHLGEAAYEAAVRRPMRLQSGGQL